MPDRPLVVLTRHFFSSMFDFGFLSNDGAESFKRALLGSAAVALGIGLLLVRVFMAKYATLSGGPADAYHRALAADHALLVAVPMWIVAAAVLLVSHALFPDETDYRVLMAEPVQRRVIFVAKLAALLLFIALIAGAAHLALLPLFLLTVLGQPDPGSIVAYSGAFALSSIAGSVCAALSIIAINGALVLCAPRSRLQAVSGIVRGGLITLLVLSLPLLVRLPATAGAFAADAWWLRWAPPAWFVGLEHWLLGDVRRARLAAEAIAVTLGALGASIGSYIVLYRRFDRVTLRPAASHAPLWPVRWRPGTGGRRQVRAAVAHFSWMTLRRSQLHQGIVLTVLAAAAGLVFNGVLVAGLSPGSNAPAPGSALPWLTVWAPTTLIFIGVPAAKLALSVPIDLRASWVFRATEDDVSRRDAVAAAIQAVLVIGVVLPTALVAPLQWWLIGSRTVPLMIVEWLIGWLFVEVLMRQWKRVPFGCSYLPGKGFVPHMFVKGIAGYVFFTGLTSSVLQRASASAAATVVFALALGAAAVTLARNRIDHSAVGSLMFEDQHPTDIIPFRLGGY